MEIKIISISTASAWCIIRREITSRKKQEIVEFCCILLFHHLYGDSTINIWSLKKISRTRAKNIIRLLNRETTKNCIASYCPELISHERYVATMDRVSLSITSRRRDFSSRQRIKKFQECFKKNSLLFFVVFPPVLHLVLVYFWQIFFSYLTE